MKNTTVALLVFVILLFTACTAYEVEFKEYTMKLTEFERYQNLPKNPEKLMVSYNGMYYGTFEITDKEQIEQITSIIFDGTITCQKHIPSGADLRVVTFVDEDGNKTEVILGKIVDGNLEYIIDLDDSIYQLLIEIGLEKGALILK